MASPLHAGPYTEVVSALDDGDPIDVAISLDYGFELHSSNVLRECYCVSDIEPTDPLAVVKDLRFESSRHVLTPRLDLGVFTDLSLSAALPIIIGDSRQLKLDPKIERNTSETIADGFLPANGFNSDDPTAGFDPASDSVFRGPTRAGIDQLHVGLTWAPMNQVRDDTKPTWKLGAEGRIAIGSPMKFDQMDPGSETSVGRGVHEIKVWTSIARRMGWAEPFIELWWIAPLGEKKDSAFDDLGFGQRRGGSQQRGGTRFGFQATLWQRPGQAQRIALDVAAHLEAHFEGRDYTEMWEVFQFAGDAAVDENLPLVLDRDPVTGGKQSLSHPGVTHVENYLRYGGRIGLETVLSENIRFGAAFEVMAVQDHLLTFADAGQDDDGNNEVDRNTDEVNPAHVEAIDLVGNRYRIEDSLGFFILVDARAVF